MNPQRTEGIFESLDLVLKDPKALTEDFKVFIEDLRKID